MTGPLHTPRIRLDGRGAGRDCIPLPTAAPRISARLTKPGWRSSQSSDFRPAAIVLDGLDFDDVSIDELNQLRGIAREADVELWMSAVVRRDAERDAAGVPSPLSELKEAVDVILTMVHDGEGMHVGLLKDHDNPNVSELKLALDPTTMLLVEQSS